MSGWAGRLFSKVVLPLPRKPVMMVTGVDVTASLMGML